MTDLPMLRNALQLVSVAAIPVLFFAIIAFALGKRVRVYESFVEGGKEGFGIFLGILPYLVAILVAIGMLRASGVLDWCCDLASPLSVWIGIPPETLPVAMMRPLSGSGSLGLAAEVVQRAPDSFNARVASTMFGSTDTTFYVVALYFGSVGIKRIRHALLAGLLADAAGILAAAWVCRVVFG